jgi:hypothetical protein
VLTNRAQFARRGHDVPLRRINEQLGDARMDAVARAGYALLHRWASTGAPPPRVERFSYADPAGTGAVQELARDQRGNVLGGVRTPWVEAPVAAYRPHSTPVPGYCLPSPWAPMGTPEMVAAMIGHAVPLPADELRALYPTRRDYLDRYEAACARLTAQGLLLEADARALLGAARDRSLPQLPEGAPPLPHERHDAHGPHDVRDPHDAHDPHHPHEEAAGTAAVQVKGTRP